MQPLIKWPGGKSGEIINIERFIPPYSRYVEPFFGGGALFFHLRPQTAAINDISQSLMEYYSLLKNQDEQLHQLLLCYWNSFSCLIKMCERDYDRILSVYHALSIGNEDKESLPQALSPIMESFVKDLICGCEEKLVLQEREFCDYLSRMVMDKMLRTVANHKKMSFEAEDLKNNLITGFLSGYYMYFRKIFNDINLKRIVCPSLQYKIANFYFVREYCYGSMFRYNKKGEFNIPYGGISYNGKNFANKIKNMFSTEVEALLRSTDIHCSDFEAFFKKVNLTERDFMFLDPPYDTNFSDYEGTDFTASDQERLAHELKHTSARFVLVIKNTDFIHGLYRGHFNIIAIDNQYTYNVRSRNERKVEHLIITNLPAVQ